MNKVILTGNLTKDLEVKIIPAKNKKQDDTIIGTFTLANNRGYGDNKTTTFVTCKIFNKRVSALEKYLVKGAKLLVSGVLDIQTYKDDNDNFRSYTSIIVDEIDLLHVPEEEKENKGYKKYSKK